MATMKTCHGMTGFHGAERRRMAAPTLTPSMRIALDDLKLDRVMVVCPGERRYRVAEGVEVVPLGEVAGEDSRKC